MKMKTQIKANENMNKYYNSMKTIRAMTLNTFIYTKYSKNK